MACSSVPLGNRARGRVQRDSSLFERCKSLGSEMRKKKKEKELRQKEASRERKRIGKMGSSVL